MTGRRERILTIVLVILILINTIITIFLWINSDNQSEQKLVTLLEFSITVNEYTSEKLNFTIHFHEPTDKLLIYNISWQIHHANLNCDWSATDNLTLVIIHTPGYWFNSTEAVMYVHNPYNNKPLAVNFEVKDDYNIRIEVPKTREEGKE